MLLATHSIMRLCDIYTPDSLIQDVSNGVLHNTNNSGLHVQISEFVQVIFGSQAFYDKTQFMTLLDDLPSLYNIFSMSLMDMLHIH